MGKKLFLFAAAAVALASCTETDLSGDTSFAKESTSDAIQFSAKTRGTGTTRNTGGIAGDITTQSLTTGNHKDKGFGVLSYYTNTDTWTSVANTKIPDFMWNQQVKYDGSNWTYSPIKYWPNDFSTTNVDNKEGTGEVDKAQGSTAGGKLSFFAYAPYVDFTPGLGTEQLGKTKVTALTATPASDDGILAITSNDAGKDPSVYYRFSASGADLEHSVDLLWGLRGNSAGYNLADKTTDTPADYNTDLTKQSVDEQVNFLFKHALAKFGGHNPSTDPSGEMEGVQIVLDIDNGGVAPSTAIYGGTKGNETLVTVEELEIYDITTAAAKPLPGVSGTSDLIKEGWFNISTGAWDLTINGGNVTKGATYSSQTDKDDTEGTEKREFEKNIKEGTPKAVLGAGDVFSKWTNSADEDITGVTTTPQDVYTKDSKVPALLMIPSSTEAQTLAVRIKYVVRTYDKNLATTGSGEGKWTKVTQTITNKVTIPGGALKENTFYKLLIHLGLTSVKFTASVADWNDATNGNTGGNINTDPDNDKDIYLPSNTIGYETHASTVESVSAAEVAANATKFYVAPKAGGEFTITLTGTHASATDFSYTVTGFGSSATITPDFANKKVTITLPDNATGEPQVTTIKIKSVDGTPITYDTTTVTLIQQES